MKFLVDVFQGWRNLYSFVYRKSQAVRLPRFMIRILTQDDDFDVPVSDAEVLIAKKCVNAVLGRK